MPSHGWWKRTRGRSLGSAHGTTQFGGRNHPGRTRQYLTQQEPFGRIVKPFSMDRGQGKVPSNAPYKLLVPGSCTTPSPLTTSRRPATNQTRCFVADTERSPAIRKLANQHIAYSFNCFMQTQLFSLALRFRSILACIALCLFRL